MICPDHGSALRARLFFEFPEFLHNIIESGSEQLVHVFRLVACNEIRSIAIP